MTDETTEEVEEVRDPQALLQAYNNLKADLAKSVADRDSLEQSIEALTAQYAESEVRGRAILAETKLALFQNGFKDVDRLLPYVGTDGLDFDEEGRLTGLDDRLATLKKDLPEVFDPKVRAGGKADIYANNPVEVQTDPLRAAVRASLGN